MVSPDSWAARMSADLDAYDALIPRTVQKGLGVSDLGLCHSKALYKLQGVTPTDSPRSRQSLHGHALHDLWTAARRAAHPDWLFGTEVVATLPSGLEVVGHLDEADPLEPSVTDYKSVGDEADVTVQRREGSSEQQRFQRHVYALGAIQAGLVPEAGLIVRNWWSDRAGQDPWGHVEQEPFSMAEVHAADDWLQSVMYAQRHGEEVPRDKHHDWCRRFCEFYTHCRAGLVTDDFVVTDPELISAARRVYDGRREEKAGKHTSDVGRRSLTVLQQSAEGDVGAFRAGEWRIRWANINRDSGPVWRLLVDKVGE